MVLIPEFTSKTLFDGNTITSKDLLGKSFIINVWGSWCYGGKPRPPPLPLLLCEAEGWETGT